MSDTSASRSYPTTDFCFGELLAKFEPTCRDTDVFTATSAKCGQTWLCTLLYHLKTKGQSPDMEGKGILNVVPWLEIPMDFERSVEPYQLDERLQSMNLMSLDIPRVFKMHVLFDEVPRPPSSKSKVITILRDLRDVPYSFYQHLQASRHGPFKERTPSFEDWFDSWLENGPYFFLHLKSFWPHFNDPNVLFLRYEDMKRDAYAETHKIVQFLGWKEDLDLTDEHITSAIELASFRNMQRTEKSVLFVGDSFHEDKNFVREGKVGTNRAKLTDDMEKRLMERAKEELPQDALDWILSEDAEQCNC